MVQTRIKPYKQMMAERERRARQRVVFRRNQVVGLVLVATFICIWTLLHTNPKWIFPTGWWRL